MKCVTFTFLIKLHDFSLIFLCVFNQLDKYTSYALSNNIENKRT